MDLQLAGHERRRELLQRFYESHHRDHRDIAQVKDHDKKLEFFVHCLRRHGIKADPGIDLGCRGGSLTRRLSDFGNWVGVDIDRQAIELANANGIPCIEADISIAIDFCDDSFDAVCATEVLEHLPYPTITVEEIHRILRKNGRSVFFGSVPLDYHLHRRVAVLRGKRLTGDPTHLRSFSFDELRELLETYFHHVEFAPLRGTKTRFRWLSWKHFVRDIAWFAKGPR